MMPRLDGGTRDDPPPIDAIQNQTDLSARDDDRIVSASLPQNSPSLHVFSELDQMLLKPRGRLAAQICASQELIRDDIKYNESRHLNCIKKGLSSYYGHPINTYINDDGSSTQEGLNKKFQDNKFARCLKAVFIGMFSLGCCGVVYYQRKTKNLKKEIKEERNQQLAFIVKFSQSPQPSAENGQYSPCRQAALSPRMVDQTPPPPYTEKPPLTPADAKQEEDQNEDDQIVFELPSLKRPSQFPSTASSRLASRLASQSASEVSSPSSSAPPSPPRLLPYPPQRDNL